MKRIITEEYGSDLAKEVARFIEKNTMTGGCCTVYRPTAVIELFDQDGKEILLKDDKK